MKPPRRTDVDRGYAWIVLSASFGLQVITGVLLWNTGIITSAILESVDGDLTRASWVGSTLTAVAELLGPAAGIYQHRFGPRVAAFTAGLCCLAGMTASFFITSVVGLLCSVGIITGCGLAIVMNIFGSVPGHYFDKKRSVAFAVSMTGGGVGMFLGSLFLSYLFEKYTFNGTLLIMGAFLFHICIAGVIIPDRNKKTSSQEVLSTNIEIVPLDKEVAADSIDDHRDVDHEHVEFSEKSKLASVVHEHVQSTKELSWRSTVTKSRTENSFDNMMNLFLNIPFGMYNISSFFWSLGESALFLHLPNYVVTKGSTYWEAGILMSVIGIGTIFSKLLAGFAATDPEIGLYLLHAGMMGVAGGITLVFPLMSNMFFKQGIYAVILGIHIGGPNSLASPIVIDLIGLPSVELGFGIMSFVCGIALLAGPPFASWIFELNNNYDYTFVFSGICFLISSFSGAVIVTLKKSESLIK